MRQRPSIRTKYRVDRPPQDGSEIVVPYTLAIKVYWDDDLERWVLAWPLHVESLIDVTRWRRP
jgi:hypothetical protein